VSSLDEFANGRFERILGNVPMGSSSESKSAGAEADASKKGESGTENESKAENSKSEKSSGAKPRASRGPRKIERVLACSGKIYYELEAEREKLDRGDVAILRFEQLYPLSDDTIAAALAPYGAKTPIAWVQEEPANMGAWPHFRLRFGDTMLGRPFHGITRAASASPATGSPSSHKIEQQEILDRAFGGL
jgi:2-oxoglutarate dehydrogenase E1 component